MIFFNSFFSSFLYRERLLFFTQVHQFSPTQQSSSQCLRDGRERKIRKLCQWVCHWTFTIYLEDTKMKKKTTTMRRRRTSVTVGNHREKIQLQNCNKMKICCLEIYFKRENEFRCGFNLISHENENFHHDF